MRYANNSNYKNDVMIRKEVYITKPVIAELRRILEESEVSESLVSHLHACLQFDLLIDDSTIAMHERDDHAPSGCTFCRVLRWSMSRRYLHAQHLYAACLLLDVCVIADTQRG